jgi:GntR family transcriptional repressor for pyruvate dehydrogenase complex
MKRLQSQNGFNTSTRRKQDITHLLIFRFQQMLNEGVLCPGAKLPSERELASHFKVARSSLRQALKVLEIIGVITQKIGDGSYLNSDASTVLQVPMDFLLLLDDTTIEELAELRLIIEPALAAKAAQRAASRDIDLLRKSVTDLAHSNGDRIKIIASDLLFHRTIFEASGSRLAVRLFHTIHRAMLDMIALTSQMVDLEHTIAFHKPILRAIERRDPEAAARLMSSHIRDATDLSYRSRKNKEGQAVREYLAAQQTVSRIAKSKSLQSEFLSDASS